MRILIPLAIIGLVGLCGCNHSDEPLLSEGSGDAGQFILQQALICGARPVATNNLPIINARWRYSVDKDGAILRSSREQFPEVKSFLHQTFGAPEQEPIQMTNNSELGSYAAKTIGVAIQFGCEKDYTQIIVLRPETKEQIFSNMATALSKKIK